MLLCRHVTTLGYDQVTQCWSSARDPKHAGLTCSLLAVAAEKWDIDIELTAGEAKVVGKGGRVREGIPVRIGEGERSDGGAGDLAGVGA